MKHLFTAFLILSAFVFFACGSKDQQGAETASTSEVNTEKPAVCIWKEVSIRETAGEKGKYKTSIFLGEKMISLADTASELSNGKRVNYRKVKLTDGAEGWVREDFIAIDAEPAAFIKEATIYKRPDIMTTSGKNFNILDFVAIKNTAEGGWVEVIGKRVGDTWFSSGWVKAENLTTQNVDVVFSSFYNRAMDIQDETKRDEEISKLLQNEELGASVFQAQFVDQTEYTEEEYLEYEGTDEAPATEEAETETSSEDATQQ